MDFDLAGNDFFWHPILAQFLAAVVAMLGAGLVVFLRFAIYSLRQQFIFYSTSYADAGGDNHIFLWSRVGW